jgi:hypothetical protein
LLERSVWRVSGEAAYDPPSMEAWKQKLAKRRERIAAMHGQCIGGNDRASQRAGELFEALKPD